MIAKELYIAVMNKARSKRAIYCRDYHFIISYRVFLFIFKLTHARDITARVTRTAK